jgi:hypothetical protein
MLSQKLCLFILLNLISYKTMANEVYTVHFLGDPKPLVLRLKSVINKDSNENPSQTSSIIFNFDKETTLGLNADFTVSKNRKDLTIVATSINKSLVYLSETVRENENHISDIEAYVKFIDSEEIISPIKNGMTDLSFKNNQLSFYAGILSNPKLYKMHLQIIRKKILAHDETLIERDLGLDDLVLESMQNEKNKVSIDLEKITNGKFDEKHKYEINISIELNYDFKNIINLEQIGPIKVGRSLTIFNQAN